MHCLFRWFSVMLLCGWAHSGIAQNYLGQFEVGEKIPFLVIAADPETGAPTNPVNLRYSILHNGKSINWGFMTTAQLGVATGTYSTDGNTPGLYDILIAGQVKGVTAQTYKTYTLLDAGKGISSIATEVGGINGLTPFTESAFLPYKNEIISTLSAEIISVTPEIAGTIETAQQTLTGRILDVQEETRIGSREHSRARLWYAQSTIDTNTRKVPADMPSHLEVQIAAPDDIEFATPLETFYRIFYYPNATTATKSSKEIRRIDPPSDGTFYLIPDQPW